MSDSLLSEELSEQPQVVERLLRDADGAISQAAVAARAAGARRVMIAARGTSDNVARYAQHLFGRFLGLPVALATPSLTTLYGGGPRLHETLVIGISQSGQSPDVCAVIEEARGQGQATVAITNVPGSPLARAAQQTIDIAAGLERSVAATKTYTASLAAIAALTAELAGAPTLRGDLATVGEAMQAQLELGTGAAAEVLGGLDRCALTGRGPNYATAFEAALKIKELTGIAAEPYSPADLMHGPVAVLGPSSPLLAFALAGPALPSIVEAEREGAERGAQRLIFSDAPAGTFAPGCRVVAVSAVAEWLSPLVAILPAQALAAELALQRGLAVDTPFGLSKVTRTL